MHFSGVTETRRVNQYCTSSVPLSREPDGLLTTGADYFNCVIVTWLCDDSVSCRYFKGRFPTSVSLQRLICPLCLYVVAFGHVFEVLREVFFSPYLQLFYTLKRGSALE